MRKAKYLFLSVVVGVAILLAACQGATTPTPSPAPAPKPSPAPAPSPSPKPSPSPSPSPKPSPTPTPTGPPYFQGKVITIVVGPGAGGGTDILARLVARFWGKFIPGNPNVLVRNMVGGGGILATNYVYKAKPDGLIMNLVSTGSIIPNMTRAAGVEYNLADFHPVVAFPVGGVHYAYSDVIKNVKDLLNPDVTKKMTWGYDTPTGGGIHYVLAKAMLGFKTVKSDGVGVKEIWGYTGSADAARAFLAKEINFSRQAMPDWLTTTSTYVAKGEVVPLYTDGVFDEKGNITRPAGAEDIPTIDEVYQMLYGKPYPKDVVWDAYLVSNVGQRTFSKTLIVTPKTPSNITSILDKAMAEMVKDKAFQAEADRIGLEPPLLGEKLPEAYKKGVYSSPEVTKWLKDTLSRDYGVAF